MKFQLSCFQNVYETKNAHFSRHFAELKWLNEFRHLYIHKLNLSTTTFLHYLLFRDFILIEQTSFEIGHIENLITLVGSFRLCESTATKKNNTWNTRLELIVLRFHVNKLTGRVIKIVKIDKTLVGKRK